jgi:hypothetical protein
MQLQGRPSDSNFIQLHLREAEAGFFLPSQSTNHSHYQNITSIIIIIIIIIIMHCTASPLLLFLCLLLSNYRYNYRYKLQLDNANGSSSGCTERERGERGKKRRENRPRTQSWRFARDTFSQTNVFYFTTAEMKKIER